MYLRRSSEDFITPIQAVIELLYRGDIPAPVTVIGGRPDSDQAIIEHRPIS
jgi:hypothetical protein